MIGYTVSLDLCDTFYDDFYWCVSFCFLFGPPKAAPILFLLSPEVSGTSGTMSRYILYIYMSTTWRTLGGSRSRWCYSVNFVSLLLFSSTKNLCDLKIRIES